jgi:TonB family protein
MIADGGSRIVRFRADVVVNLSRNKKVEKRQKGQRNFCLFCLFLPFLLSLHVYGGIRMDAQKQRANYGPIVAAYLTGLAEELNELDFQLKHREISRSDYDRSKQRLILLRRYIERLAAQSREDQVPELQILADQELGMIGFDAKRNPGGLQVGDLFDSEWKILGIERGRIRFFVFQRLAPEERPYTESPLNDRRTNRKVNPQEVIETIVIRERPWPQPEPLPQSEARSSAAQAIPRAEKTLPAEPKSVTTGEGRLQGVRVVYIYLPQYTDKARSRSIEGDLVLHALFRSEGGIGDVKVEKGLGHGLDQQAIDAAKRIVFIPAHLDGKAVDARVQIIYNFKIEKVTFHLNMEVTGASAPGARP